MLRRLKYLRFLCITVILIFVLAEVAARTFVGLFADGGFFMLTATADQFNKYCMTRSPLIPHPYIGFVLRPNYKEGLISYNSRGFRGGEFAVPKPENEFRIVCVGGSTTYDDEIRDDTKTYPARLQSYLEREGYSVKVINAGVPAWTSYENLINFALRVSSISPDLIIDNDGRLDLALRMVPPEDYAGDNTAIRGCTIPQLPWYDRLTLVRLLELMTLSGEESITRSPAWILMNRPTKNFMPVPAGPYSKYPTLSVALKQNPPVFFRRNLVNLVVMARAQGAQTLLLTYPYSRVPQTFAISDADPEGKKLCDLFFFSMDEMNAVIKSVGAETQAPVFDLENTFPPLDDSHKYYVDGIHNTEAGADLKASLIADYIVKTALIPDRYHAGKAAVSSGTP